VESKWLNANIDRNKFFNGIEVVSVEAKKTS